MGDHAVARRSALGLLAASATAVALAGNFCRDPAQAIADEGGAGVSDARQYGFMVRVRNCVNCGKCVETCREHNGTPNGVEARRSISTYVNARGKDVHVSTSCMQCEDPACLKVCPAGAISKGEGGVVVVDHARCIGCKYCYQACPYGVPHYTSEGMDKCDCCLGNDIELGQEPWCVQKCRFGALEFGPLDELEAKANGKAKRLEGQTVPALLLR